MDVRCTHWPLATGGSDGGRIADAQEKTQGISASSGCVHYYTGARKTPSKLPFSPFLATFGAACRREGSIGNMLEHQEIGHDPCWAGPSKNQVGIGAPKLP